MDYRILVADDDPAIVNILKTSLEQAGYRVETAGDGNSACALASAQRFHLIVMDVMMPGCSGLLATMRIREKATSPFSCSPPRLRAATGS